jgi:hypothetical protein
MTVRWWKWLGLAGALGVAATGVAVARDERRRRSYTPAEIRERLHARHDESVRTDENGPKPLEGPHTRR